MAYETTDNFITNNYTPGREGLDTMIFFVVHTYNGPGRSLYNWFQDNPYGVSSHKARFKDGLGERYVRREDTAHHAGNWWANVRSIGIEHMDDGQPADSVRTAEEYEGTSQDIAQEAFEIGHKVLNASNIQPHWAFASTGCPGGLDIDRIRQRSNELLQLKLNPPEPVIPDWKKKAVDIGTTNFTIEKDVQMVNLENGSVIQTFTTGTVIGVRYLTGDYYVTEYSYDKTIPAGFKKEDLEYKKPDKITYEVDLEVYNNITPTGSTKFFDTLNEAESSYSEILLTMHGGDTLSLVEVNETQQTDKILKSYTKPAFNFFKWLYHIIADIIKRISGK
jgi:hypothetical protein